MGGLSFGGGYFGQYSADPLALLPDEGPPADPVEFFLVPATDRMFVVAADGRLAVVDD